ncbi:MAG: PDZ domain-containing protein [Planctomycetota bacterium]
MATPRILALATKGLATAALAVGLSAQEKELPKPKPDVSKPDATKAKAKAADAKAQGKYEWVASLGVETRAPSKEECIKYALKLEVRYQGQLVTGLAKDGVAAKAGIEKGDIILKLGKVEIFSSDDIRDLVMVRRPGQLIEVRLTRGKTKKQETLSVRLGAKKIPARKVPRLDWQYAGLPYLQDVLRRAKKQRKRVLVGLSGAET